MLSRFKRYDLHQLDWEKLGRAGIEYGGIPLAAYMSVGVLIPYLRNLGFYHSFIDPSLNMPFYYVVNFWLVVGVYMYRQRFQHTLLLEQKKEVGVAAAAALAWIIVQPIALLVGYAMYLVAVMKKDKLQGSFLPDVDDDSLTEPTVDEETQRGISDRLKQFIPH